MPKYKTLSIRVPGPYSETQVYIAEESVTEEQVLGGEDDGIVCLCLMPDKAELISALLNGVGGLIDEHNKIQAKKSSQADP